MNKEIRTYHWRDGKELLVGTKTLIMGILNYTPDSFSDGGTWNSVDAALAHMEEMVEKGLPSSILVLNLRGRDLRLLVLMKK